MRQLRETMGLDQFLKDREYEIAQDLAPPIPTIGPGAEVKRRVPIRAPSIGADVGPVFCWALGSGFFAFLLAAFVSLAIKQPLWGALVWAGLVAAGVWFSMLVDWRALLVATEDITGLDLDGDGYSGEPEMPQPSTHFTLPTGPGSVRMGELDLAPELVIDWCHAARNGYSLSFTSWQGRFALPDGSQGRERYQEFRTWLVKEKYAEEIGGNVGLRIRWQDQDAVRFISGFATTRPEDGTPLLEG